MDTDDAPPTPDLETVERLRLRATQLVILTGGKFERYGSLWHWNPPLACWVRCREGGAIDTHIRSLGFSINTALVLSPEKPEWPAPKLPLLILRP